jgi:hypothetical protein
MPRSTNLDKLKTVIIFLRKIIQVVSLWNTLSNKLFFNVFLDFLFSIYPFFTLCAQYMGAKDGSFTVRIHISKPLSYLLIWWIKPKWSGMKGFEGRLTRDPLSQMVLPQRRLTTWSFFLPFCESINAWSLFLPNGSVFFSLFRCPC